MWLALNLKDKADLSIYGKTVELSIKNMADGCVGCLLAFETKDDAAAYAGEGSSIVEIGYGEE